MKRVTQSCKTGQKNSPAPPARGEKTRSAPPRTSRRQKYLKFSCGAPYRKASVVTAAAKCAQKNQAIQPAYKSRDMRYCQFQPHRTTQSQFANQREKRMFMCNCKIRVNSCANQKKHLRCRTSVCISVGCSNFSFGESTKKHFFGEV